MSARDPETLARRAQWARTCMLIVAYPGRPDGELDRALALAVGRAPEWQGDGEEHGQRVTERAWEFEGRIGAEAQRLAGAALQRVSSGVSSSRFNATIRRKGI